MRTFVHFAKAISLLIYVGSTIGAGDIVQLVSGLLQKIAQQRSVEHACCVCNISMCKLFPAWFNAYRNSWDQLLRNPLLRDIVHQTE